MAMETEALPIGLDLTGITPEDLVALRRAVRSLEHPGFAARLTNMVGKPIELIGDVLPASASHVIATATSKGLEGALKVALRTIQGTPHAGIAAPAQGLSHSIRCSRWCLRVSDTSH